VAAPVQEQVVFALSRGLHREALDAR
jgi:hypothetical protein